MPFVCPACGEVRISVRHKLTSTLLFPACCPGCHSLVAARPGAGRLFLCVLLQEALLYGSLIGAFLWWSWWPLIIGGAALLLLPYALWWRSPLIVRSGAQVAKDRRNAGMLVLVLGALVVLMVVLGG